MVGKKVMKRKVAGIFYRQGFANDCSRGGLFSPRVIEFDDDSFYLKKDGSLLGFICGHHPRGV